MFEVMIAYIYGLKYMNVSVLDVVLTYVSLISVQNIQPYSEISMTEYSSHIFLSL